MERLRHIHEKSGKILSLCSVKEVLTLFSDGLFSSGGVGGAVEFLLVALQSCQYIRRVANPYNGFFSSQGIGGTTASRSWESGEIFSVGSVAKLVILFWWFLFIMSDRWSARAYIGLSVLAFSSYQQPTFQYLATCLPSHNFNNHTIMASLPDDQCTLKIMFDLEEDDGTLLRRSATPSEATMTIHRRFHRAIDQGWPDQSVKEILKLQTESMLDDVDEEVSRIHSSRATINAANTAVPPTRHNPSENPSAAADNRTGSNPEGPPAPTKQGQ